MTPCEQCDIREGIISMLTEEGNAQRTKFNAMYALLKEFQRTIDDDHYYHARLNDVIVQVEAK